MKIKKKPVSKKLRLLVLILLALSFIASLYGIYFIYQKPATIERKTPTYSYEHKGNLTCKAPIKPNMVIKKPFWGPGETIYRKLMESFKVIFSYQYSGDKTAEIKGTYDIIATVEAKDMWKLDFELVPKTAFSEKGKNISITEKMTIDFDYFNDIVKKVEEQLGVGAGSPRLLIKANIDLEATSAQGTVKESIGPTMTLPVAGSTFTVEGELTDSKDGALYKTVPVPNPVKNKMAYAIALSFFSGLSLILFFFLTQNKVITDTARKQELDFWKKYGDRIVKVNDTLNPTDIINVNSMDDLIKIADETEKPIIYQDNVDPTFPPACYVFDGPTAYKHIRVVRDNIITSQTTKPSINDFSTSV